MITIEILPEYPFCVYTLKGSLDALGVQTFEKEVLSKTQSEKFVVLQMKELSFLSSAGIRKIITLEKELRGKGGYLFLTEISDSVRQVLEISGLLSQFHITVSLKEALALLSRTSRDEHHHKDFNFSERKYSFSRLENNYSDITAWQSESRTSENLLHLSVNELGFGIGKGCFAEDRDTAATNISPFLSVPGFFVFKPETDTHPTDYLHTGNAGVHGVYIHQYIGTNTHPYCQVDIPFQKAISQEVLIDDLFTMATDLLRLSPAVLGSGGFLKTLNSKAELEYYLCFSWMILKKEINSASKMQAIKDFLPFMQQDEEMYYLSRFMRIQGLSTIPGDTHFKSCIEAILQDEKLDFELVSDFTTDISEGRLWLFLPEQFRDFNENRLNIETTDNNSIPDRWDLIIRSVFAGNSKVILQQLHGGFSAKTFMVASYDKDGRKRLPTVLKLGGTNIIGREERRYHEFVKPFILNNSVSVLGATYYGDTGGICYNFLGVGGPESKLRWLTHIYKENDAEFLIPLFDKIFKGILKPWYGQPKWDKLYLYKDHSPLFPFFPNVIEDAKRILGVDANEQYLDCPYLGRKVLNPYWYLKHEWPKHEQESMLYYSSVCHGDLNMQNILIDEKENIYIIDFSETGVRNVVSDFARLEPIFKMEMSRMNDENDLAEKIRFEEAIVKMDILGEHTELRYEGDDPAMIKAYHMITRVREYARQVTVFEEDPLPYWLAVLEWTLPYVSYGSVNPLIQKHAVFSAGLICERIFK